MRGKSGKTLYTFITKCNHVYIYIKVLLMRNKRLHKITKIKRVPHNITFKCIVKNIVLGIL